MKFIDVTYEDLNNLKIALDFNNDDQVSLKIYNIYRRFFTEYLIKKLNLIDYDKLLQELNINNNDLDFYKKYSSNYLKYIFVRNNLYISKLTNEEKEYLLKNENSDLNDDIIHFIENTYKRVINGFGDNDYCFYGKQIKNYLVKSDMIVIGIYNDKYDSIINNRVHEISLSIESMMDNVKVLIYKKDTYEEEDVFPMKR